MMRARMPPVLTVGRNQESTEWTVKDGEDTKWEPDVTTSFMIIIEG